MRAKSKSKNLRKKVLSLHGLHSLHGLLSAGYMVCALCVLSKCNVVILGSCFRMINEKATSPLCGESVAKD